MKQKLLKVLIILSALLAIYAVVRIPQWKTEDDIREAAFRYEFSNYGSASMGVRDYYVSVIPGWSKVSISHKEPLVDRALKTLGLAREPSDRWGGPSASFGLVHRFRNHRPPVRAASECRIPDAMGVTDVRGSRTGIVFVAGRIRWLSPTKIEVEGGYYENGMSSSGNVYTLVRRHSRWVVIHDKLLWIS